MTDKWGLEKLLNAARVTRACQRLLKKKKGEFDKLLSILHANVQDGACGLGVGFVFFLVGFFFFFPLLSFSEVVFIFVCLLIPSI